MNINQLISEKKYYEALNALKVNKINLENHFLKDDLINNTEYYSTISYIGLMYSLLEDYESSLPYYYESLMIKYDPNVGYNYSIALLHSGEIQKGFSFYHNRYKKNNINEKNALIFPYLPISHIDNINRLQKEDRLIVLNEQGLGDELLFSKAIEDVCSRVSFVKWKVNPTFMRFFKERYKHIKNIEFFVKKFSEKEVYTYTCWSNTGDLFATTDLSIKEDVQKQFSIDLSKKLNIGISYSANVIDRKNTPLEDLTYRRIINKDKLLFLKEKHNLIDYTVGDKIDGIKSYPNPNSYYETYKNIKKEKIDLIVTIDSSFAHFTATIGIPTIVIINKYHDWRWKYNTKNNINKFFNKIKILKIEELKSFFGD